MLWNYLMVCCTGRKVLKGCWPSCPLVQLQPPPCWLIELKDLACHCRHHTHCQPPRANTANYFSLPNSSSASQCPFILIFLLSAICFLNNTPPHFPTIPYPLCLLLYSLAWMVLPKHNCLLLVWCLQIPASLLFSYFPSLLFSYTSPALNCRGLVTGVSATQRMLSV